MVVKAPKVQSTYEGPCILLRKFLPIIFVIRLNVNAPVRVVHHSKLKPFKGSSVVHGRKALPASIVFGEEVSSLEASKYVSRTGIGQRCLLSCSSVKSAHVVRL